MTTWRVILLHPSPGRPNLRREPNARMTPLPRDNGHMTQATRSPQARTTYILGAGFSRAVSSDMPITDELGSLAADRMGLVHVSTVPHFVGDGITFETWMTWLSERQPYQSESEHLEDQAMFARFTQTLASILEERETAAKRGGLPGWLSDFIDVLHHSSADVITMNYDTLIESALDLDVRLDSSGRVDSSSVVTGFPNGPVMMFTAEREFAERGSFKLHKLHGSVDWFSVPGDRSGSTLGRLSPERFRNPAVRDMAAGGREVFLVPPTSTKSGYFDNPKTRFVWGSSRRALQEAGRVVLMGYSLPLTDSAITRLLWSTLANGNQEIVVVDRAPKPICGRLEALGIDPSRITSHEGSDCVANYVDALVGRLSSDLAHSLTSELADRPVAIGWNEHAVGAIIEHHFDPLEHTLHLTIDSLSQPLGSIRHPGNENPGPEARPTRTIGELLADGVSRRIVAHLADSTWTVAWKASTPPPDATDWTLLVPAGRRPT